MKRMKKSEKEVEAEIDASSICEKNVETRDDGFTDEVCGRKEEEEEIEADYGASSSLFSRTSNLKFNVVFYSLH